jgi:DNA (cytosine-5)-methyltransferase 1
LAAFGKSGHVASSKKYRVIPVIGHGNKSLTNEYEAHDYVVACEKYGIPQLRHRVILVGIREDLGDVDLQPLIPKKAPTVNEVLSDLPQLRSGLSRRRSGVAYRKLCDGPDEWVEVIKGQTLRNGEGPCRWLKTLSNGADKEVYARIVEVVRGLKPSQFDRGDEFVPFERDRDSKNPLGWWYFDDDIHGVCNHHTRGHMDKDLARYLYATCFADVHKVSPRLSDFPAPLQPDHENASTGDFADRFRVQIGEQPSTTITSHISKDGHYFIHPDPNQCRSMTVREAARLQTFPDNYYFCGPRTAQCVQVGNAVPPLLAHQIAKSIWSILEQTS